MYKPSVLPIFIVSHLSPQAMADSFQKKVVIVGLLLLTIAVASIAYYFVIALPRNNAAKLKFEQDKYTEEKSTRERRESAEEYEKASQKGEDEARKTILDICLNSADSNSEEFVLMNGGQKTPQGTITAPGRIWDEAAKKKKTEKDECYRKYK